MLEKQEAIQRLLTLQSEHPDKEISRKFFRDETQLADSEFERHFGTWLQFKTAAGLEHSKVQKKILSSVNKHSSVDTLNNFNCQKEGYAEKFLKPNGERFQTILTGSDIHDKLCDTFYRRLFINTAYRVQPQKIVLAGDIFDMYEFSRYNKDPRKTNIMEAIDWVHDFLSDLRGAAPNSEIIMLEGNHENRLITNLAEASPHIMPILDQLHGFTVGTLLGLDAYEVNFVSRSNLAVFRETETKKEIAKNYYVAYDAVLFHHFPFASTWGLPGFNGHHHNHKVTYHYSVMNGPYEWHQLGAGHVRAAEYCEGSKWSNGFALCHVDTHKKFTQVEYFDTTHSHCVIGGRWYERLDGEKQPGLSGQ